MQRIIYYFKTAAANIRRNVVLNVVSIVTISLALLILGAFVFLHHNLQTLVVSSTETLTMSIYLKDGLAPVDVEELKTRISAIPGVQNMKFIDKEEALADLKARLGDQDVLLEGLEENPLPASFELDLGTEVRREGRIEILVDRIKAMTGVDDVSYAWDWADKLKVLVRFVKLGGMVIGGLLFLAIVFIIANTIKLTVMARWDELYIMRLMGATETFVRTPFVIEGVVQGLVGGVAAIAMLYVAYLLLASQVQLPFGLSLVKMTFLPADWCWFVVLAGGGLGFLGSIFSVGRFSKS